MRHRWTFSIALLAIALATGCSHAPNDAVLVTSIQSQMFADQQLKNANIQVTANKGEVTLAGTVPTTRRTWTPTKSLRRLRA